MSKYTDEDYLRVREKYKTLKRIAEKLILTEYAWRVGPYAYSDPVQAALFKAEDEFRECLTGSACLKEAALLINPDLELPKKKISRVK